MDVWGVSGRPAAEGSVSIIQPTPGQLIDRLAVIRLKIAALRASGGDELHFLREQDEIIKALSIHDNLPLAEIDALTKVHKELWGVLDEQRERVRNGAGRSADAILADLWELNQERALLREAIDQRLGCWEGREKL